jgi:hypothetical protein
LASKPEGAGEPTKDFKALFSHITSRFWSWMLLSRVYEIIV